VAPGDSLAAGQALSLNVTASDQKARPMTVGLVAWSSSNPAVARFASDGTLLCITPGTTTVSAKVGDVVGQRVLTITQRPPGPLPVATVAVTPYAIELEIGSSRSMAVRLRDFAGDSLGGRAITWTTSNDSIAIVAADGLVTARGAGVAIIEATSEGRRGAVQVTVRPQVDASVFVAIANPLTGAEISDTLVVVVAARAAAPIDSVILVVGGQRARMVPTPIGALGFSIAYVAFMDVAALPFGQHSIVVTAFDNQGRFGIKVQPFMHNTLLEGGGSRPAGGAK
jgi:hypothetical protein